MQTSSIVVYMVSKGSEPDCNHHLHYCNLLAQWTLQLRHLRQHAYISHAVWHGFIL